MKGFLDDSATTLKKMDTNFTTVIWYASTTEEWAKSQTIEHFINEYKPSYILLCLGSNELFVNDLDAREAYIKQF